MRCWVDDELAALLAVLFGLTGLISALLTRTPFSIINYMPVILNHAVGGGTWTDYAVDEARERALTSRISEGSPLLWSAAETVIRDAVARGWLKPGSVSAD
jgi:hypothetical protein